MVCQTSVNKYPECREVIQLYFLVSEALKLKKGELETT